MELWGDNNEMNFRQDLMAKWLDWLLDSVARNPKQRCNKEDVLQAVMAPKWLGSSRHAFPHSYTRN
jgi:hypothetical protein